MEYEDQEVQVKLDLADMILEEIAGETAEILGKNELKLDSLEARVGKRALFGQAQPRKRTFIR